MRTLEVAISTCPNDTFAFHGLLTGAVTVPGAELRFTLADVEELNRGLAEGRFDVAKASFHAALSLAGEMIVLPAGSALGFGVGPLLLASREYAARLAEAGLCSAGDREGSERSPGRAVTLLPGTRALTPGTQTTAALLLALFARTTDGRPLATEPVVFSEIMPRLRDGSADVGVCIHEGRFTWRESGLACLADLGTAWEGLTGAPLPLGGILGRRSLGDDLLTRVADAIGRSIDHGHAHRDETIATMRRYAQEYSPEVCLAHVDLYVNAWTRDLGAVGRGALARLAAEARRAGLVPPDGPTLLVHGPAATAPATRR